MDDLRDRRLLLADRGVNAHDAGVALIEDRVDRHGRLAGLAIADDQLALPAADRDHRVDRLDAGVQRLVDPLAIHDARREPLDRGERKRRDAAFPSSGRPSASTTRPSSASPTGTEMMRDVRRTASPSLMCLDAPRRTTPTRSSSRFSARPNRPPPNSSISPSIPPRTPLTPAMPSPTEMTRPTSTA